MRKKIRFLSVLSFIKQALGFSIIFQELSCVGKGGLGNFYAVDNSCKLFCSSLVIKGRYLGIGFVVFGGFFNEKMLVCQGGNLRLVGYAQNLAGGRNLFKLESYLLCS